MEPKFKEGQRVRGILTGRLGTVLTVPRDDYTVEWDEHSLPGGRYPEAVLAPAEAPEPCPEEPHKEPKFKNRDKVRVGEITGRVHLEALTIYGGCGVWAGYHYLVQRDDGVKDVWGEDSLTPAERWVRCDGDHRLAPHGTAIVGPIERLVGEGDGA